MMNNKKPELPPEAASPEDDLRSSLLLGSQSIPDRSLFRERLNFLTPTRFISLAIIAGLILLGWLLFAGPGKPAMLKLLVSLSECVQAPASTTVAAIKPIPEKTAPFTAPASPTETLLHSPTRPSISATSTSSLLIGEMTATAFLPSSSPTNSPPPTLTLTVIPSATPSATTLPTASIAGCVPAASVTTADVGKTLCVTGYVLRTDAKPNSFLIILENLKDAFYFLSYDRKWEDLKKGECVHATGKIAQLGNNPVMILDYKVPLEYCP